MLSFVCLPFSEFYRSLVFILFLTSSFFNFNNSAFAQDNDFFLNHLNKSSYSLDTTAEAIILLSKGEAFVDPYNGNKLKITRIVKILKNEAIDRWGVIKEDFRYAKPTKIKVFTYNLVNGNVEKTEIQEELIFSDKIDKDRNELRIGIPNVRVGSIIELTYNLNFFGYFIPDWFFQKSIPTLHSEFQLYNSLNTKINYTVTGQQPLNYFEELVQDKEYRWIMKNIPGFKMEPLMPLSVDKYFSMLMVTPANSIKKTWESVRESILVRDCYGAIILPNSTLKKVADSLLRVYPKDTLGLIKGATEYVKNKVKWNEEDDIYAKPMDEILKNKSGTSGDINLLLLNILRKCNLVVTTIFLRTRDEGIIDKNKPSIGTFNYVIGLVLSKSNPILVDGTSKYLSYNQIPQRCANVTGFIITTTGYDWIDIAVNQKLKSVTNINITISESGYAVSDITINKYGYASSINRVAINLSGKDEYLSGFGKNKIWEITSSEVFNINDIDKPLIEKYQISGSEGIVTIQDQRLLIDPFTFSRHTNLLTQRERRYPIDFGVALEDIVVFNINIPEGYQVESLPESKGLTLPNGEAKLLLNITQNKSQLTITYSVQINRTYFEPVEYKSLFELFSRISSLENELIILRKN